MLDKLKKFNNNIKKQISFCYFTMLKILRIIFRIEKNIQIKVDLFKEKRYPKDIPKSIVPYMSKQDGIAKKHNSYNNREIIILYL
jgi:hypothetical protein